MRERERGSENEREREEVFEIKCLQSSYIGKTNDEVLNKAGMERLLVIKEKEMRLKYFGNIAREGNITVKSKMLGIMERQRTEEDQE